MSNLTVCVRFRPLSLKEQANIGDATCIHSMDAETFTFKGSEQVEIYEFLAAPIVRDAFNAVNGTIITYGQTGAGKTYSIEGPCILECDVKKKGLLPRVVEELFRCITFSTEVKYTIKLSMVEIYMEKVRDLFDLSKDNLQIKESKTQGIFLAGVTEISIVDPTEALKSLYGGIANRSVGETQMNMASSRSHCVYIFSVQQESTVEGWIRTGKLVLVDLAGSEKVEKTGAEGRVLEEAKTINKSLSALGNVISALTNGKVNHIPYRDSKLTRILQDALGGNSRTALLCCCSPSSLNTSESLSTLRFGARVKLIKFSPRVNSIKQEDDIKPLSTIRSSSESFSNVINKLQGSMTIDTVKLLEDLLIVEGIFDVPSAEDMESLFEDVTSRTISSLHRAVEELSENIEKLKKENDEIKTRLADVEHQNSCTKVDTKISIIYGIISSFFSKLRFPNHCRSL